MPWPSPAYSREAVNRAGRVLISPAPSLQDYSDAIAIINNWRASHSFPLRTFQGNLRHHAEAVYRSAVVAQRLKRISSITLKLQLRPTMRLAQMQDIGGCRAVLLSVSQVKQLRRRYGEWFAHELVDEDDYISKPRDSGYRGIHLVYAYNNPNWSEYHGLRVEVQMRSRLQHAWATAVEIVGTFTHQSLKSSQGEADWLRFFALMGSAFAHSERTTLVPDTPTTSKALKSELRHYARVLDVHQVLERFTEGLAIAPLLGPREGRWVVMVLDTNERKLTTWAHRRLPDAEQRLENLEHDMAGRAGVDAVLVSVSQLKSLRRAYPNYFGDTNVFAAALDLWLR
jgi:hypothetical protein